MHSIYIYIHSRRVRGSATSLICFISLLSCLCAVDLSSCVVDRLCLLFGLYVSSCMLSKFIGLFMCSGLGALRLPMSSREQKAMMLTIVV